MDKHINKAWELFFEGKIAEAKQLVEEAYQVETCLEYSALNLFAYLYLEEKNGEQALLACQRYIQLARSEKDVEQEHIGLHQLAMVYRSQGEFKKAIALPFMKRSLGNALMTDDLIAQACAYRGLGEIYAASTATALAKQAFEQSITAFEEAGDDIGVNEIRELMTTYQII